MSAVTTPIRSFLFVPGDSERKLAKVAASAADAVILDLEDAVSESRKPLARQLVSEFIAGGLRLARARPKRPPGGVTSFRGLEPHRTVVPITYNVRRRGRKGGSVMAAAPELGKALSPAHPSGVAEPSR